MLPAEPDARLLRSFLVLAEELHFGRAATRLSVVQPTLSQHLSRLEAQLGVRLVERTTRRVRLTEAGEALAAQAREPLSRLHAAVLEAQRIGRQAAGALHVGFVGSAANELTSGILQAFERDHPGVEVQLRSVAISDPSAGVLDGSSDVGFVRDFRGHPAVRTLPLLVEGRLWVLPAGHPLADRPRLREQELEGVPTVALVPELPPPLAGTWAERPGTTRPVGGRATTIDAWLALVAAGRGATSAPASARRYFARPGVAFVPAVDLPSSEVSVAWRADDARGLTRRFVACAREVAAGG